MNLMSFSNNLFPFFMPKVFLREYRNFASSNFVIKKSPFCILKKYLQDRSKFIFYKKKDFVNGQKMLYLRKF